MEHSELYQVFFETIGALACSGSSGGGGGGGGGSGGQDELRAELRAGKLLESSSSVGGQLTYMPRAMSISGGGGAAIEDTFWYCEQCTLRNDWPRRKCAGKSGGKMMMSR